VQRAKERSVIIVFLGPPGSGKGTQAQMLDDEHGFYHFDTGSVLRAEVASGSELGGRIATYIDQGLLVPLEIIRELLLRFFSETKAERIMLDGFPRDLDQAKVLDEGLARLGDDLDHVFYLDVERNALLERIVNRRSCPTCGEIYNISTDPPARPGVCDKDGAALVQRKDDTAEVFTNRLQVYLEQTMPLLDYYRQRGLLRRIDGARPAEDISREIAELLGV
jgi:adenylate kinase